MSVLILYDAVVPNFHCTSSPSLVLYLFRTTQYICTISVFYISSIFFEPIPTPLKTMGKGDKEGQKEDVDCTNIWDGGPAEGAGGHYTIRGGSVKDATKVGDVSWILTPPPPYGTRTELDFTQEAWRSKTPDPAGSRTRVKVAFSSSKGGTLCDAVTEGWRRYRWRSTSI